MKSKSIGSLILLAIVAPSCGGGGGGDDAPPKLPNFVKWQSQQRVPTSSDLRSVIFADIDHGIVAGKNGSFFRTDNGGASWTQQEIAPPNRTGDVAAMSALGTTLVAVGADAANGLARSFVGTHDSVSWLTPDAVATGPVYVDVNVSDAGFGNTGGTYWMLRSDGVIDYIFQATSGSFTTVNATPTQPGCPQPFILPITWTQANGIVFLGGTGTGLVCGTSGTFAGDAGCPLVMPTPIPPNPAHGPIGQIIVTTNFGTTWRVQDITTTMNVVRRMFITHTAGGLARGYAIADDPTNFGRLLVTNFDIPDRWDLVGNAPANMPVFHGLSFPENDLAGWLVGDGGTIYKVTATTVYTPPVPPSTPGFWTYTYAWALQPSAGVTENLWSVSMLDNNNGYIVGDKGTVLKMTGGGAWTKISKGDAGVTFNAASFTEDGVKGLAVGDSGKIYRTLDGGLTWTPMTSGTAQNLLGAAVPRTGAGTTAYVCGMGATLLRSADVWTTGTWGAVTGTTGGDTYRSILFPRDELAGVCVGTANGGGSRLLRTSTGTAWAAAGTPPTGPSAQYNALSTNGVGSVIYASGGSNGLVSFTGDIPGSWDLWSDLAPSPGGALTLSSIASPEGAVYRAFAAADDNRVWRMSTPVPQTWSPTVNPWGAVNPVSLGFQNDLNGLTVLANGQIYYTTDGGASWLRSYPHTKDVPRAIWMSQSVLGLGYVLANDGTILKTISSGH